MSLKLVDFDPVDYLKTEKAVTEFLKAAKEESDANHIEQAQLIAERARRRNAHKKRRSTFTKSIRVRIRLIKKFHPGLVLRLFRLAFLFLLQFRNSQRYRKMTAQRQIREGTLQF